MEELGRIRSKLVDMLLDPDVINLLHFLREMNVLNDEEKETVEGWMTSEGKARCLIDTVMEKGVKASSVMVDYLTEKHPELCSTLGLTPTAQIRQDLTDDQLLKVAETLGKEWKQAAFHLGLKPNELDDIKAEHKSLIYKKHKMLVLWKRKRRTGEATAQELLRCLKDIPDETRLLLTGHISDKTVVKRRNQNKGELQRIHSEFVKTVKISVIKGLLDDLLQQKVFSTDDKYSVMEKGKIKTDMARCLIDMVIRKGERASRIMIASMKKKYYDLCSTLGLIASPAGVGHTSDKTEVKPRKQNKGNGGRKRNGSKSEEVSNKKPCTVDVSDSITETRSIGQTLTDKELMNVAKTLGNELEQIAIHLEITTKALEDIKAEHRSVATQKLKMLVMWKCRRPPGKATAQDLLEGLKDLEDLPAETLQLLTDLIKQ